MFSRSGPPGEQGARGEVQSSLDQPLMEGVFRVPRCELLAEPLVVVWRQVLTSSFVIICDELENLVLASNFLSTLVACVCKVFGEGPGVLSAPERLSSAPGKMLVLMDRLLPGGHLQFMHPSMSDFVTSSSFQPGGPDHVGDRDPRKRGREGAAAGSAAAEEGREAKETGTGAA